MAKGKTAHRVGIISMIDDEQIALQQCFTNFFGESEIHYLSKYSDFPFRVYNPPEIFCCPDEELELLYFHINATGNVDVGTLTTAAIIEQHLNYVLLVGVAGGRASKMKHFDIIVPSNVYFYEIGKVAAGKFTSYNKNVQPNAKLRNWARAVSMETKWLDRLPTKFHTFSDHPDVAFGALAAGDKVVTDSNHQIWVDVCTHAPKTLATEMESYGCLKAAYETGTPALTIRGISDLLDDKDADAKSDEGNKQVAAAVAATFATALLGRIKSDQPGRLRAVLVIGDCDLSDAQLAKQILKNVFGDRLTPTIFEKSSLRVTVEGDEQALRALGIAVDAQLLHELSTSITFRAPEVEEAEKAVSVGLQVHSRMLALARRGQEPSSELFGIVAQSGLVTDEALQGILATRIYAEAHRLTAAAFAVDPSVPRGLSLKQLPAWGGLSADQYLRLVITHVNNLERFPGARQYRQALQASLTGFESDFEPRRLMLGQDLLVEFALTPEKCEQNGILIGKRTALFLFDVEPYGARGKWYKRLSESDYRRRFEAKPVKMGKKLLFTYAEAWIMLGLNPSTLQDAAVRLGRLYSSKF